ncbi:unnamed protein product [Linum trigynum]|uniref:RNase H type-1 domain-containing protein n=1 Tax=Linum trigynum TaxID=586398 RepID=A0AAV2EZ28_9ROSI
MVAQGVWWKLNTDEVAQSHEITTIEAELWAIHQGVKFAWEKGIKLPITKSNSKLAAMVLIQTRPDSFHTLATFSQYNPKTKNRLRAIDSRGSHIP